MIFFLFYIIFLLSITVCVSSECKNNLTYMENYGIIENVIAYENRAVFNEENHKKNIRNIHISNIYINRTNVFDGVLLWT